MPAVPAIIMAGANIAGTALSAHSQNSVARQQAAAAERAAQIQAKAEADALAFQREQEAARQREWQQTQDYNAQQYAQEFGGALARCIHRIEPVRTRAVLDGDHWVVA